MNKITFIPLRFVLIRLIGLAEWIIKNPRIVIVSLALVIVLFWVLSWLSCGSAVEVETPSGSKIGNINENIAIKKNDANVAENEAINAQVVADATKVNSNKALDNLNKAKNVKVTNANRESILKELE